MDWDCRVYRISLPHSAFIFTHLHTCTHAHIHMSILAVILIANHTISVPQSRLIFIHIHTVHADHITTPYPIHIFTLIFTYIPTYTLTGSPSYLTCPCWLYDTPTSNAQIYLHINRFAFLLNLSQVSGTFDEEQRSVYESAEFSAHVSYTLSHSSPTRHYSWCSTRYSRHFILSLLSLVRLQSIYIYNICTYVDVVTICSSVISWYFLNRFDTNTCMGCVRLTVLRSYSSSSLSRLPRLHKIVSLVFTTSSSLPRLPRLHYLISLV